MARKKYTPQKATLREMVSNYLKENNDARIKIVQNKRDHLNLLFHAILKKRRRKGVWPCQRGQDGYTGALKAPVRCFGNHLSEKRESLFQTR